MAFTVFCTSTPTASVMSDVSASTDLMPATRASAPEQHAPSTRVHGFHRSPSSMAGISAARLPWLLKRAAMKLPITPSSTFAAPPTCCSTPRPASRM